MRKLLKFGAPWCAPCKALSTTLATMLDDFPDIEVQEINVDVDNKLPFEHRVKSLPTLVLDGRQLVGNHAASKVRAFLEGKAHG
jgi:thioredoxin 1